MYAAIESLKIAYKTMADHGWLPDGADIVERTIDTAERALQENDENLLAELAHEKTGEEWERLNGPPWQRLRDKTIYGDILRLATNFGAPATLRQLRIGKKEHAKRYLLGAAGYLMTGSNRYALHLVCIMCRDIMILPMLGYASKQPGRRIKEGEEIIASVISHAMTIDLSSKSC